MSSDDELVFRLRTDVIRLNRENQELRRRLGIPLDGRCVTVAVDNSVSQQSQSQSQSHETVSQSHAGDEPWTAEGVSKATYYRRLKNNNPLSN